jgi:outer membrane receptor protein involved in Fe transport
MKRLLLLLLVFLNTTLAISQVTIKGKIIEQNTNQPLEFATVIILKQNSEETITGTITNSDGEFSLNLEPNSYDIKVEFLGFKPYVQTNVSIEKDMVLPNITLQESTEALDGVEIIAEKSTTEYKLDKRIFNVGKDLLSKSGSASDILNNVPSVRVDIEGGISLRGNANVRVLINGKPSVLTNNNGLEQIPAETIEKIEVITNPSSRYDAEGTAGILNIILKKNKIGGFSSSLQLTSGYRPDHGLNYNANYKTEKFNLFSNFRYRYVKQVGNGSLFRTNYNNNVPLSFLDQTIHLERTWKIFNLYIGSDYYFNENNTTTFSYFHRNNKSENKIDYVLNFLDSSKNIDSVIRNTEHYKEPQRADRIELNHVKTFSKKGQKLTLDVQYDFWDDDENENIKEQKENVINTLISKNIESSKDLLFQTDLNLPSTESTHFEVGLKGEIRNIDSDYKVWDNSVLIDSLDNLLKYKERIYGLYAQYGNRKHRLQYLIGLRTEHSYTKSTDRNNQFKTDKKYTNLFPTAHLTYNFNETTNLQISYSRRIRRPRFGQLNPFGGIADRRNIRVGNPDLNPMYTNSFELGFLKRWNGLMLNPSIYYQKTTQLFETQVTLNDGVVISKPINSGEENRLGIELALQLSPYKWWRLSNEFNFYTFNQKGIYNVEDNTWSTRLNSRIRLQDFIFQTSFNYQGQRNSGQILTKSILWADLSLGKDLFGDKASVTFNLRNIFDSRIRKQLITGENYDILRNLRFSGRRFSVTFTYRFNRSKKDQDRIPD